MLQKMIFFSFPPTPLVLCKVAHPNTGVDLVGGGGGRWLIGVAMYVGLLCYTLHLLCYTLQCKVSLGIVRSR